MQAPLNTALSGPGKARLALRSLVNQLVSDSLATAIQQKTVIVNEVPTALHIAAEESALIPVIGELLATIVANSRKGKIYISAERFRDFILLHLQERNNYNGYALAYSIKCIESRAALAGASISIKGQQALETTISLSIPTHPGIPIFDC